MDIMNAGYTIQQPIEGSCWNEQGQSKDTNVPASSAASNLILTSTALISVMHLSYLYLHIFAKIDEPKIQSDNTSILLQNHV